MIYKLVTARGKVLKYGITKAAIGKARYTQRYLASIWARYIEIKSFPGRVVGYAAERGAIVAHEAATGVRPILNKFYR